MNKFENFWQDVLFIIEANSNNKNSLIDRINELIKNQFNEDIFIECSYYNNKMEIVFCGGHNMNKINTINKIISFKPIIKNIDFIGPKPGFGFDFTLNIDDKNIDASKISFYPLKKEGVNELGISLHLKGQHNINKEILWKIIETGIGEEKSSKISYITYTDKYDEESLNIDMLDNYMDWYLKKTIK